MLDNIFFCGGGGGGGGAFSHFYIVRKCHSLHSSLLEISSRKQAFIVLTPLNPTYSKTGVYRGKHYACYVLLKNIDCGYSLEPPRRGGSNEYHSLCFEQKYEKYQNFI